MLMLNKEHKDAKDNLARIRDIIGSLPPYLRFDVKFNAENKPLKILKNKEDAYNHKTNNKLVTKPSATSEAKADNLGRGMTVPFIWFDEFAFLKYNMIIYEAAAPAAGQAAEEAEKKGMPHCIMITTTPGDLRTDYGKDALAFRQKCAIFKEEYYNWNISDVKEFVRMNSTNGFFLISFSYQQLGRGTDYFDKCLRELGGNFFKMRREVLLEWISIADDGPFDDSDLEKLSQVTYTPEQAYNSIYIDKYNLLTLYQPIPKNCPMIVSCDVGTGSRRDYSTIAIINSRTKECIGEFCNNKVDTLDFSSIIHAVATKIVPNCMVVIERNNVGHAVITNLLRTEVRNKLYYEITNDEIKQQIKDGRLVDKATDSRFFGVWTNEDRREMMMELLVKFVHLYRNRIRTPILSSQISALVFNKKGRIDHLPNGHDDMVMGFLIGMYVLYYGKNLNKYGIINMPDVDPSTGLTEEEVFAQQMINQEQKNQNLQRTASKLTAEPDDELIEVNKPLKTLNDYYKEIDAERERAYDINNGGSIPLERVLGATGTDGNKIDLLNGGSSYISNNNNFGQQLLDDILGGDF